MRIQVFPPLAFILVVTMVFAALKPGLERAQDWRAVVRAVPEQGLSVEGEGLGAMIATERASVEISGAADGPYAVIGSVGAVTAQDVFGVHYLTPPDAVRALRGETLDLVFEVRAADGAESSEWLARVAIAGFLDSGWTTLTAGRDWSRAIMRITVPENDRYVPMVVMMWSDAKGDGGRLEVRSIALEPTNPAEGPA